MDGHNRIFGDTRLALAGRLALERSLYSPPSWIWSRLANAANFSNPSWFVSHVSQVSLLPFRTNRERKKNNREGHRNRILYSFKGFLSFVEPIPSRLCGRDR